MVVFGYCQHRLGLAIKTGSGIDSRCPGPVRSVPARWSGRAVRVLWLVRRSHVEARANSEGPRRPVYGSSAAAASLDRSRSAQARMSFSLCGGKGSQPVRDIT